MPACACLCLWPIAGFFDARHNFTERGPAGSRIPSGIFDVCLSYSSILTRISGLGCELSHSSRAARNRVVSWASFSPLTCWVRGGSSSLHPPEFVLSSFDGSVFSFIVQGVPGLSSPCLPPLVCPFDCPRLVMCCPSFLPALTFSSRDLRVPCRDIPCSFSSLSPSLFIFPLALAACLPVCSVVRPHVILLHSLPAYLLLPPYPPSFASLWLYLSHVSRCSPFRLSLPPRSCFLMPSLFFDASSVCTEETFKVSRPGLRSSPLRYASASLLRW